MAKHQKLIKKKSVTEWSETMDKYALMNKFQHDRRLQVNMYAFVYVDTNTTEK